MFPNSPMSWILLFATVLCIAMQASFSLSQDTKNLLHADNSKSISNLNITHAEEMIKHHLDQASELDDEFNDTRNCFPYFISQDIESLLNQALRMLSKSKSDRQRSWLRLFVRRLESLSIQLRRLPVKYVNRCFQVKEELKPEEVSNLDLSSAPEDVQLQFAKKLFLGNGNHHRNDRIQEYVTGRISTQRHQEPKAEDQPVSDTAQTNPNQSKKNHIAQSSNKGIENKKETLNRNAEMLSHLDLNAVKAYLHHKNNNNLNLVSRFPIAFWNKESFNLENMPFLPRSTRKILPYPPEGKMRFRALANHVNPQDIIGTPDASVAEIQTLPSTQSSDKNSEVKIQHEAATTSIPTSEEHTEQYNLKISTQQYHEPSAQFEDHAFNTLQSTGSNYKSVTEEGVTKELDDDLVIQLHSGIKSSMAPKDAIDPRVIMKKRPINVKVVPSSSIASEETSEPSATKKITEIEEKEESNFEETPVNLKAEQIEDITGANHVAKSKINTSDFDYEEDGAAAGELFIDDEVIPTKYLTAPSLGGSTEGYNDDVDEAVQQLDDLKSAKIHDAPSSATMQIKESESTEVLNENNSANIQNLSEGGK